MKCNTKKISYLFLNKEMKKRNKDKKEREEWFKKLKKFAPLPDVERGILTQSALASGQRIGHFAGRLEGTHEGIKSYIERDSPQFRVDMHDPITNEIHTGFFAKKADVARHIDSMTLGQIKASTVSSRLQKIDENKESFLVDFPSAPGTTFDKGKKKIKFELQLDDYSGIGPSTKDTSHWSTDEKDIRNRSILVTNLLPAMKNRPIRFDPKRPISRGDIKSQWDGWVLRGL